MPNCFAALVRLEQSREAEPGAQLPPARTLLARVRRRSRGGNNSWLRRRAANVRCRANVAPRRSHPGCDAAQFRTSVPRFDREGRSRHRSWRGPTRRRQVATSRRPLLCGIRRIGEVVARCHRRAALAEHCDALHVFLLHRQPAPCHLSVGTEPSRHQPITQLPYLRRDRGDDPVVIKDLADAPLSPRDGLIDSI